MASIGIGKLASFGAGLLLSGMLSCASAPAREVAAPTPPPEDAQQYYPLEPGWKWAYDVERGTERILAVYAVRERRGNLAVLEAGTETLRYEAGPDGIARTAGGFQGDQRGSNDFLIKSPVRAGASWPIEGGLATVTGFGRSITVEAGTFENCLVVEEARQAPARLVRTTYAPGVGPIAIESLVQLPGKSTYESTLRASLRGVTRPGEDPLR